MNKTRVGTERIEVTRNSQKSPDLECGDLFSYGFDNSGSIRPRGVGQGRLAGVVSAADVGVHWINTCRVHLDQYLLHTQTAT